LVAVHTFFYTRLIACPHAEGINIVFAQDLRFYKQISDLPYASYTGIVSCISHFQAQVEVHRFVKMRNSSPTRHLPTVEPSRSKRILPREQGYYFGLELHQ
jgi:hypothetical protein